MKFQSIARLLGALFILGTATQTLPSHAAQRVSSEPLVASKAGPTAALQWRADGFPTRLVSRLQYRELPAARILQVEKYNATRKMKPAQIGVSRSAATEGAANAALPGLDWIALADGSAVARIEVLSPVALGLRVGLEIGMLDPRAELRFAGSSDPSRIVAVMTGKEILELTDRQGLFWTPGTDGEKQYIEVYVPAGAQRLATRLRAPQVSHLLTNSRNDFKMLEKIGESGACNVDVVCRVNELGANFVLAKNAVAHMVFTYSTGATFICTGTLLNDTVAATQIPYFYSANHCFAGGGGQPVQDFQTVASSLNTFWKYEASTCGGSTVPGGGRGTQLTGGADYLYSNPDTDGMLLRLRTTPPAGSELAGWDSTALPASSAIIGIHHPAGDAKMVSSGQHVPADSDGFLNSVGWLSGTTEGGSSGSGLFTADGDGYHLRGGLYGGSASCDNDGALGNAGNRDYYSRFDVVFPNIRNYLAPAVANVAPVANFIFVANGLTVTFTDSSTDSDGTIASRAWNFGDGTSSTAANPVKTYTTPGTYNVGLTVTDNGGLSNNRTRAVVVVVPRLPVHDYNGDGKSDILWRQNTTGQNSVWFAGNSAAAQNLVGVTGSAWRIVGTGDFDGDGKTDIVWRNFTTGANTIWKAGNQANQQAVTGITDMAWKIVGVGDFNGDRKSDLLWRHDTRGANTVWFSGNSATIQNLTSVTGTVWKIVGVGDFGGDGKADILWRNGSSGANAIWTSGNSATQAPIAAIPNLNWKVAGIGDFNGDRKSDILWRDSSSGANVIWRSGSNATQQAVATVVGAPWIVASVADYDGNGMSDILWHNTTTGASAIWKAGSNANQQAVTTVSNTAWVIIP